MIMDRDHVPQKVRARVGTVSGVLGIVLNLLLFGMKLAVGLLTGYVSVTADAFNNLTDSFSSIVSLISFKLSGKPADEDHPFGHERVEYVSSMIVAFIVLFLAWELAMRDTPNTSHIASTLYFPRNRSMTRYFSFTSFQLLTENFAAAPPSSAAEQSRCSA